MITHLSFSGGNVKAITFLGIYRYLLTYNKLQYLKDVAGTSFGAIVASMIATRCNMEEIEEGFTEFCKDEKLRFIDYSKVFELPDNLGLVEARSFLIHFINNMQKKHNRLLTFMEVSKIYGINLHINAYNISKNEIEIFNTDNTPDLDIITGLSASVSVPIVFKPVIINDDVYVDPFFKQNIIVFDNVPNTQKLNVICYTKTEIEYKTRFNIIEYITRILNCATDTMFCHSTERFADNDYTLLIHEDPFKLSQTFVLEAQDDGLNYSVSKELLDHSIVFGFKKAKEYFETKNANICLEKP